MAKGETETPKRLVQDWNDIGAELKVRTKMSVEDCPCLVVEDSAGRTLVLEFDGKDFIWAVVGRGHE